MGARCWIAPRENAGCDLHPAVVVRLLNCWSVLADLTRTPDRVFGCSSQHHLDIGMARHDPIPESVARSLLHQPGRREPWARTFSERPSLAWRLELRSPGTRIPAGTRPAHYECHRLSLNQEDNGRSGRHGTLLFQR